MSWRARLTANLHELRFVYCPKSTASAGTREFLKKEYPILKALNPGLPIYIRPCDGATPMVAARYGRGLYEQVWTSGKGATDVCAAVETLSETGMSKAVEGGIGGGFRLADVV